MPSTDTESAADIQERRQTLSNKIDALIEKVMSIRENQDSTKRMREALLESWKKELLDYIDNDVNFSKGSSFDTICGLINTLFDRETTHFVKSILSFLHFLIISDNGTSLVRLRFQSNYAKE